MSKAEDLAAKLIIPKQVDDIKELCKFYYIKGYHQAEKDLELTWEDIKLLDKIFMNEKIMSGLILGEKEYEEILKRFRERKEK